MWTCRLEIFRTTISKRMGKWFAGIVYIDDLAFRIYFPILEISLRYLRTWGCDKKCIMNKLIVCVLYMHVCVYSHTIHNCFTATLMFN